MNEDMNETINHEKHQLLVNFVIGVVLAGMLLWICMLTGTVARMGNEIDELRALATIETIPETEGVVETTECTTAPVIDTGSLGEDSGETVIETTESTTSVPTTEETIHNLVPIEPVETTAPEAPSTSVTTDPDTNEDMSELEMLACVIYQEAGGDHQCDDCRRRVADVVLNRVADPRFPNTMYEVLTAKSQYGRFHWTGIVWPSRAKNAGEKHAVERAWRIAEEVLNGQHSELYGNGYIWQAQFKQSNDNIYCCGHYYGR